MLDLTKTVQHLQALTLDPERSVQFITSTDRSMQLAVITMLRVGIQCIDEVINSIENDGKAGRQAMAIVLRSTADTIGA
jgi:hypothetical protein